MNSKGIKVCMISCTHGLEDDRIYWKESISLAKDGYHLTHIAVGNEEKDYTTVENVHLIQLKRNNKSLVKRYQVYLAVFKTAALQKAAVYHLHDWQLNIIAGSLKKLPWKPKVVYDAHENTELLLEQDAVEKNLKGIKKAYYTIKARKAVKLEKNKTSIYDAIIAAEENVLTAFKDVPHQIREVIHNYSYFIAEEKNLNHPKKYDAVYAGLLAPNRGIKELIDVARICASQKNDFKLLLIGSFHDKGFESYIKSEIIDTSLQNNIELLDSVPYSEIQLYLLQSRIGLCTWWLTEKNRQAIPIKIFEYMACGLPVVISNDGVASDYVSQHRCGLLVNPVSPNEIAATITRLLNEKDLYSDMAIKGQQAVNNGLNWKHEEKKLLRLYEKLLLP